MSNLDDDDEYLVHLLETEVLSEVSDPEDEDTTEREERQMKRGRTSDDTGDKETDFGDAEGNGDVEHAAVRWLKRARSEDSFGDCKVGFRGIVADGLSKIGGPSWGETVDKMDKKRIEGGILSKIPPELFYHILKFLSCEDLISCSQVCKFLNYAASEESLWRRLYWIRWKELFPPSKKLRDCAWKKLYFQRDEEEMIKSVSNFPPELKEYCIQMHAAKRSEAPLLSQVSDNQIVDETVAERVSIWKRSKGLSDKMVNDHTCSGEVCSYFRIGNVFICEKTGNVHVCDDTCKEVGPDPENEHLVCRISGHSFDRLMSLSETEEDAEEEEQRGVVTDEAEPFMGSGRFARAYQLGYNCADEKELEAALRFC